MSILNRAEIAQRLRAFRESKNLSGRKFALAADIDASHYAKVEHEQIAISDTILTKLLNTYPDLTREYILFGRNPGPVTSSPLLSAITPEMAASYGNFITVADTILQLMPTIKPDASQEEQLKAYLEREEKYFMALEVLKAGIVSLNIGAPNTTPEK